MTQERPEMPEIIVPKRVLADGRAIPVLGFGVWRIDEAATEQAVADAFDAGYRLIDTAALYENEAAVGRAVATAVDGGIARSDIFVTSKVLNSDQGYDATLHAFDESMTKLGFDTLDLYLIHWPAPARDQYVDTWKALIRLQSEGRVTSIGVSNFLAAHIERIVGETGVAPVLNQVELHPYLQQKELRAYHAEHDIATQAWRPIGGGRGLLDDPVVRDVAGRAGCSPAQAVLAWHRAMNVLAIPKSVHRERIQENLRSLTVELPAEDLAMINSLDRRHRYGQDPATHD